MGSIRRRKAAQGFEQHPARCCNCTHYQPPMWGRPQTELEPKPYKQPTCGIGGFAVHAHSICDRWEGADGAVLEMLDAGGPKT